MISKTAKDCFDNFFSKKSNHEYVKDIHVALIFKDFAAWLKTSCVGLNIAGYTTATVLKKEGLDVSVFPVRHNIDIVTAIDKYQEETKIKLTHAVISAPWLSVHDLKALLNHFPYIKFLILSHSNVGFLQADPWGVELFRHYIELKKTYKNIEVGGNSAKFSNWLSKAFNTKAILLPNLYPLAENISMKLVWDGVSAIKIGIFGAPRAQKNFMTAVGSAILIQQSLGVKVEIHMNSDVEDSNNVVSLAITQMTKNLDNITLVKHNWAYWDDFIKIVADMDLLLQPSYTESFNMVTADGISVGVPSVVSPAIYWAPNSWKAETDDCTDIANRGIFLLKNYKARQKGLKALRSHNDNSLSYWFKYFGIKRRGLFDKLLGK